MPITDQQIRAMAERLYANHAILVKLQGEKPRTTASKDAADMLLTLIAERPCATVASVPSEESVSALTFQRLRVRGGVVVIRCGEDFVGEIATCKWGYALRLPGVCWKADRSPAYGGSSQLGFKRQRNAVDYMRTLNCNWVHRAIITSEDHKIQLA